MLLWYSIMFGLKVEENETEQVEKEKKSTDGIYCENKRFIATNIVYGSI